LSEEDIRGYLGAFGFGEDFVDRAVRGLSGGQRSRLGLLKLVLMRHNLLVLDEPTNHLDLDSIDLVERGLRDFDGTLLLVSHDRQLLSRAVDKLLVLVGGRTRLFHGGYEEYVKSLRGRPLWSEIELHEAERQRAHTDRAPKAIPVRRKTTVTEAPSRTTTPKVSKNELSRLRKELDGLEDRIISLEVDLEEIEAALADAANLGSEQIQAASRQHAEKKKELAAQNARWETLAEEFENKSQLLQQAEGKKSKRKG
jgi:ATP-binding cassette subfamily F protein 3